jgi:hypothetical protein
MEQVSDQPRQYLERGFAELLGFIQVVWTWSSGEFIKVTQAQWGSWPLWKQILFVIVIAAVVYFLFVAALQLWTAAIKVLAAFATFIGTVIVTLPTIFIAGLIALAGMWVLNNFHDLSDLRSLITFHNPAGGAPHVDSP